MDGMIVKSLTMDIESLKQELAKSTKKIKGLKRLTFIFGVALTVGGVELYLQNKKVAELEEDINDLKCNKYNERFGVDDVTDN